MNKTPGLAHWEMASKVRQVKKQDQQVFWTIELQIPIIIPDWDCLSENYDFLWQEITEYFYLQRADNAPF